VNEPIERLFRRESGRIVATLARVFGANHLGLAEDVAQEAFCRALEIWPFRGVPDNPAAWLMATAKNCARDALRRERTARNCAPELEQSLTSEWTLSPAVEELFEPNAIKDDVLRMMFSCCHPRLPEAAQAALMLNILCGLSANEIASAFVTSQAAMEKRIMRAKRVLASSKALFDVSVPADLSERLPAAHRALYLLFNEGYHGASAERSVRIDLCQEAMRLTAVLMEHPQGATPVTCALAALMSFGAARLPARVDASGDLNSLAEQDRSKWNHRLISDGLKLLDISAAGEELTGYHVEAAIASVHARASRVQDTDWARIVALYDALMALHPSPIVALNRAIAIGQYEGPERGLDAVRSIADTDRLASFPFYSAALGEFELRRGSHEKARGHFRAALAVARNPMERRFLERRVQACESDEVPDAHFEQFLGAHGVTSDCAAEGEPPP
jgi:RNA polymerase sigma factor (sigma-70 family)